MNGAELVIHNAEFDVEFLNHELRRLPGMPQDLRECCGVLDTLALARQLHPGQRNSLDALAKRYSVDNSKREFHGALLDAQILAEIYLAMTGGQSQPVAREQRVRRRGGRRRPSSASTGAGSTLTVQPATAEEQRGHEVLLAAMAKRGKPIWRELEQQAADAARAAAAPAAAA